MGYFFNLIKKATEMGGNLVFVLVFLLHPSVRGAVRAHFFPIGIALIAYLLASIWIQCRTLQQYRWPQKNEKFPFTRWAMFAGLHEDVEETRIYEWQGLGAGDERVELNPARLFVTTNAVGHYTKTHSLAALVLADEPERAAMGEKAASDYATGLMRRWNQLHPNDSIHSVLLWERSIRMVRGADIPEPYDPDSCRVVFEFSSDK